MAKVTDLKEKYSPMYFLAALGAGGLAVSFFMYLNFLVPHKGVPMITADILFPKIAQGNLISFLIVLAFAGIVFFAFKHIELLIWNIKEYNKFKQTEAFEKLKTSNAEVSLMAIPLTYSMAINVMFVLGATFVPGLWSIIEIMLPLALLGFLGVGIYGLRIYAEYFTRLIVKGDFNYEANNNFSQLVAIFAFSMIAVGFAAPGAMSHNIVVSAFGIFGAIFFGIIAVSLAMVKIVLALRDILEHGVGKETSVSLWIMIPILTVLGITFIRVTFGFTHNFLGLDAPSNWFLFLLTSSIFALQLIFGYIGYKVMKQVGYFEDYIHGDAKSPASFAIICPGVAFFVFGVFFLIMGLVFNGIVLMYSPVFFILLAMLAVVQAITIKVFFKLEKKLIKA